MGPRLTSLRLHLSVARVDTFVPHPEAQDLAAGADAGIPSCMASPWLKSRLLIYSHTMPTAPGSAARAERPACDVSRRSCVASRKSRRSRRAEGATEGGEAGGWWVCVGGRRLGETDNVGRSTTRRITPPLSMAMEVFTTSTLSPIFSRANKHTIQYGLHTRFGLHHKRWDVPSPLHPRPGSSLRFPRLRPLRRLPLHRLAPPPLLFPK